MQKSPTECRTVERTGRECVECCVTKMNVKIHGQWRPDRVDRVDKV